MNKNKIVAVDLFCGVGGLTYGLNKSGINVAAGFDFDEGCKFAYEKNNKNSKFVHKDIADITKKDIKSFFKGAQVTVLAGCAPCQTFSSLSIKIRKTKDLQKDKRWTLLNHFSRIINEANPDFVIMENVPLLQKQMIFKEFIKNLESSDYVVNYKIINCSNVGVAQNRRRLILLAVKKNISKEINFIEKVGRVLNVKDVIFSLPKIKAGEKSNTDPLHVSAKLDEINLKRIKCSKPGGTWNDWPKELCAKCHQKESGSSYSSVYGRMEWNKPSPTITTQFCRYGTGRFGHPTQNRALSLREGAILQSFPKNYKFIKNKSNFSTVKIATQIGNAVPPKLGEYIGHKIKSLLNN